MVYGYEVGALVRMRSHPEWGTGQVQSIIGNKVTVNFEHCGKMVLIGDALDLELVSPDHL